MALVIYDSAYGNTKQIAEAIAAALGPGAGCMPVDEVRTGNMPKDLLVVGCPINAWHPTPKTTAFLNDLLPQSLAGVKAAAFDTRIRSAFSGNAAKKIGRKLTRAGATMIAAPQGFYVEGTPGPLAAGELEKAQDWARTLMGLAK